MRDLLEQQIIQDAKDGDTTVFAEVLSKLNDNIIFNALSDANQLKYNNSKYYYEIHVVGKNGFSTTVVSEIPLDDDEVILLAYEEDSLHGDDQHYIDYVDELSFEEWNTHFNFN